MADILSESSGAGGAGTPDDIAVRPATEQSTTPPAPRPAPVLKMGRFEEVCHRQTWARTARGAIAAAFLVPLSVAVGIGLAIQTIPTPWWVLALYGVGVLVTMGILIARQVGIDVERRRVSSLTGWYVSKLETQNALLEGLVSGLGDDVEAIQHQAVTLKDDVDRTLAAADAILETATTTQASAATIEQVTADTAAAVEEARWTSQQVRTRVHLLPPASAVDPMGDVCAWCAAATEQAFQAKGAGRPEALKHAIRVVLLGCLRVMRRWERFGRQWEFVDPVGWQPVYNGVDVEGIRFAANVMEFVHKTDPRAHDLLPGVRFGSDPNDFGSDDGLLHLRTDLTVVLEGAAADDDAIPHDELIKTADPFVLRAPSREAAAAWPLTEAEEAGEEKGFGALPGAPVAFARREAHALRKASEIATWCRKQGRFPPETGPELQEYLQAMRVGSVYSVFLGQSLRAGAALAATPPTLGQRTATAESGRPIPEYLQYQPVGVVNCHMDREDALDNEVLAELYVDSTRPLQLMLARLLADLVREERDARRAESQEHNRDDGTT